MTEWEKLRSRYGSTRQYKNRRIGISSSDIEDFQNYLIDNGCDIQSRKLPQELFRFRCNAGVGIVYESLAGSLLAHDMAENYLEAQGW